MSLDELEISEVTVLTDGGAGIREDDIIIAFMGPIGSGKSFFIDLLTSNRPSKRANSALKSSMAKIEVTVLNHKRYPARRIVLVDTPGFDDTQRSDMEVLEIIGKWLTKNYQSHVRLTGILYLHRITDNRMCGSLYRTLRMFGTLVGQDALKNVVLVSTMWQNLKSTSSAPISPISPISPSSPSLSQWASSTSSPHQHQDPTTTTTTTTTTVPNDAPTDALTLGTSREHELLQTFWSPFLTRGSSHHRLSSPTFTSAWTIIHSLISSSQEYEKLQLQKEIDDLKKDLRETEAGKGLYDDVQKLLSEQRVLVREVVELAKGGGGEGGVDVGERGEGEEGREEGEEGREEGARGGVEVNGKGKGKGKGKAKEGTGGNGNKDAVVREEVRIRLEKEAKRIEKAFWETFENVQKKVPRVSFGRRILLFFLGTRARSASTSASASAGMGID